MTATSVQNQIRSMPAACTIGSTIGTTISTIGTHSSGQPSTKISARITISIMVGGSDMLVSSCATNSALPRRENTEPNRFEAATSSRIMLETSSVWNADLLSLAQFMRPEPTVSRKVAKQPTAPASVGVAMPARITPSVDRITTTTGSDAEQQVLDHRPERSRALVHAAAAGRATD